MLYDGTVRQSLTREILLTHGIPFALTTAPNG